MMQRTLISLQPCFSLFLLQAANTQMTWEGGRPRKFFRQQMYLAGLECESLMCHILVIVRILRVFFSQAGESSRPPNPC